MNIVACYLRLENLDRIKKCASSVMVVSNLVFSSEFQDKVFLEVN